MLIKLFSAYWQLVLPLLAALVTIRVVLPVVQQWLERAIVLCAVGLSLWQLTDSASFYSGLVFSVLTLVWFSWTLSPGPFERKSFIHGYIALLAGWFIGAPDIYSLGLFYLATQCMTALAVHHTRPFAVLIANKRMDWFEAQALLLVCVVVYQLLFKEMPLVLIGNQLLPHLLFIAIAVTFLLSVRLWFTVLRKIHDPVLTAMIIGQIILPCAWLVLWRQNLLPEKSSLETVLSIACMGYGVYVLARYRVLLSLHIAWLMPLLAGYWAAEASAPMLRTFLLSLVLLGATFLMYSAHYSTRLPTESSEANRDRQHNTPMVVYLLAVLGVPVAGLVSYWWQHMVAANFFSGLWQVLALSIWLMYCALSFYWCLQLKMITLSGKQRLVIMWLYLLSILIFGLLPGFSPWYLR